MAEKICPLKFSSVTLKADGKVTGSCQCEAEKCKWWYAEANSCCLNYLPVIADRIVMVEGTIRAKKS